MHQKVLEICAALEAGGVPYAIGGAIALGYCTEPRTTTDIDVNVFLDGAPASEALIALRDADIPFDYDELRAGCERDGQARFDWGGTFVDLFFVNAPFRSASAKRSRRVRFGEGEMWVLGCEDLVVYKAMFGRRRDWADIESIIHGVGPRFDREHARGWLVAMVGEEDERVKEFDAIYAEAMAAEAEDGGVPPEDE